LSDLIAHLPAAAFEGLRDHAGDHWLVVDLDPTCMTSLLHSEADDATRPAPHQARRDVAAPGYAGRKRADLVRTRMTALLANAGRWLFSFAQPGHGQRLPVLRRACDALRTLHRFLPGAPPVLVRAAGAFGYAVYAATIQTAGHPFLLRCSDDRQVLSNPTVQAVLAQGSAVRMREPGSQVEREVFDVPTLQWSSADGRFSVTTRMVVTRRAVLASQARPTVGHRHDGWVYELFAVDLPPSSCSAAEVVSLYLGRGLLERALGQEDAELPTDRWICSVGLGQDLFQRLCQWVWNQRVVLGSALLGGVAVRQTEWIVPVESQAAVPIASLPTGIPSASAPTHAALADAALACAPADVALADAALADAALADAALACGPVEAAPDAAAPDAAPADDAPADGASARYSANDFVRDAQGVVHCPAGEVMRRVELRPRRSGLRERLEAPTGACPPCAQRVACRGREQPFARARMLDLPVHAAVPRAAAAPVHAATPATGRASRAVDARQVVDAPAVARPPSSDPPPWRHPVLQWTDVAASQARTAFVEALAREHFAWLPAPTTTAATPARPTIALTTRAQRARRGRTWTQLVERNDCPPERLHSRLVITGIPAELAAAIGLRTPATCGPGHPFGPATESSEVVATA